MSSIRPANDDKFLVMKHFWGQMKYPGDIFSAVARDDSFVTGYREQHSMTPSSASHGAPYTLLRNGQIKYGHNDCPVWDEFWRNVVCIKHFA